MNRSHSIYIYMQWNKSMETNYQQPLIIDIVHQKFY